VEKAFRPFSYRSGRGVARKAGVRVLVGDTNEDPHPALRATLSRCDGRGTEELVVDLGEVILA